MRYPVTLILLVAMLSASCSNNKSAQTPDDTSPTAVSASDDEEVADDESAAESPESPPQTMMETAGTPSAPTAAAVDGRVADARERLSSTEPGKLVWNAIEAQGGLRPWYGSGPLYYRFTYKPLGDRGPTDTYQTVDPWSSLARHQLASDESVEFGWNGKVAWVNPPDADLPTNARFWSLTPYYFVGIPFVLADPGVVLEMMPDASFEETTYRLVKASFTRGTGDAPGDYYILYIHPETSRVEAIRYVVSYPGFYPDGGHGAEKLMSYDGSQSAGALTFPESYRTFKFDEESGELGKQVTAITLSDLEWRPDTPMSYFEPLENAKIIDGWK